MRRTIITIFLIVSVSIIQGQTEEKSSFQLPYNSVNVEFLGNVFLFGSMNYERVLMHKNKSYLTGRLGLGYFQDFDIVKIWSVPMLFNFLYNFNKILSIEVGAGTTIFIQNAEKEYENGVVPVIAGFTGIRLHSINQFKGFAFRLGFTPIYAVKQTYWFNQKSIMPWGGISIGYCFGKN
jgi:hypothetical protein